jgi:hypothetical protein
VAGSHQTSESGSEGPRCIMMWHHDVAPSRVGPGAAPPSLVGTAASELHVPASDTGMVALSVRHMQLVTVDGHGGPSESRLAPGRGAPAHDCRPSQLSKVETRFLIANLKVGR